MPSGVYPRKDIDERFWDKVDFEDPIFPENGCMLWKDGWKSFGYPRFSVGRRGQRKNFYAYRWLYEHLNGPLPEGTELDHLCRVRHCVNPNHLEPVPHLENLRRSPIHSMSKTHCPQGHPYTSENTRIKGTRRVCRICESLYRKKKKEKYAG
jgi:HNH endonuclease